MSGKRMIITAFMFSAVFVIAFGILFHMSGPLVSYIAGTPLKAFIHYRWDDVSKDGDRSVRAELEYKNDKFLINVSGNGEMMDFDSNEKQIAWHELQSMTTGWYLQPELIDIGDGITYIGAYSFSDYSLLKQVNLPRSLTRIGRYAFLNCSDLDKVIYNGTIEEWNSVKCENGWKDGCAVKRIECTDGFQKVD